MASSSIPIRATPLDPGEIAPDFELPDSAGGTQRLSELCASGPLVLLFYRGHW
jgi:peroxiredoxin